MAHGKEVASTVARLAPANLQMCAPAELKMTVPRSSAAWTSEKSILASSKEFPRGVETEATCQPLRLSVLPRSASKKSSLTAFSKSFISNHFEKTLESTFMAFWISDSCKTNGRPRNPSGTEFRIPEKAADILSSNTRVSAMVSSGATDVVVACKEVALSFPK